MMRLRLCLAWLVLALVPASAHAQLVMAPGAGSQPLVRLLYPDGTEKSFFAYDPALGGGVRVAIGDVNGGASRTSSPAPGRAAVRMSRSSAARICRSSTASLPMLRNSPAGCLSRPAMWTAAAYSHSASSSSGVSGSARASLVDARATRLVADAGSPRGHV